MSARKSSRSVRAPRSGRDGRVVHSGASQAGASSLPQGSTPPRRSGEQKRTRRRRRMMIIGIIIAILVALLALVRFVPIITVSSFEIKGNAHTTKEEIINASGIESGDNMLAVNTSRAANRIVNLPWINQATVKRSWPSTITITVAEKSVSFYVSSGGDHLFDSQGKEFIVAEHPANTLKLDGPVPSNADLAHSVAVVASTIESKLPDQVDKIDHLAAANENDISLVFKDGRTVMWGTSDNPDSKAEATKVVLQRDGKNWNVSNPAQVTVS